MPFLVDTCVISELYRPAPDVNVRRFVEGQRSEDLFVSVMTLAEIRRGLLILPQGDDATNWLLGQDGPKTGTPTASSASIVGWPGHGPKG